MSGPAGQMLTGLIWMPAFGMGSSAIKSEGLLGNQSSKALHSLEVENKDVSGGSEVERCGDGWTGNQAALPHRRLSPTP